MLTLCPPPPPPNFYNISGLTGIPRKGLEIRYPPIPKILTKPKDMPIISLTPPPSISLLLSIWNNHPQPPSNFHVLIKLLDFFED